MSDSIELQIKPKDAGDIAHTEELLRRSLEDWKRHEGSVETVTSCILALIWAHYRFTASADGGQS